MKKFNYIVFDVETGGLDPYQNPITQIALLSCEGEHFTELNRYETFVKPYSEEFIIEDKALNASLVTKSDINNRGKEYDYVYNVIKKFLSQNTVKGGYKDQGLPLLVGHNVCFDIEFLKVLFAINEDNLYNYVQHFHNTINLVDTMKLSQLRWRKFSSGEDDKYNLTSCCKRIGYTLTSAHGAMNDVIATWNLFKYFFTNSTNTDTKNSEPKIISKSRTTFKF